MYDMLLLLLHLKGCTMVIRTENEINSDNGIGLSAQAISWGIKITAVHRRRAGTTVGYII